ncbi:c-type cytochrome [Aquisediminimonas sediminicola]|uniref:c-type cytochrome n=1 Tax=Alteraquisediminimonas sediminicola TaxID=2676787 RepID=UPI001C8DB38C|nr:cytochrome c [Aquisediminimonas sediminicola]
MNIRYISHRLLVVMAMMGASVPALAVGPGFKLPPAETGEQVYVQACQTCHQPGGKGGAGAASAYPALANNPKLGVAAYPILTILRGRAAMPWFGGTLSSAQIAKLVTYLRTNFGNNYATPVTEDDVKKLSVNLPVSGE